MVQQAAGTRFERKQAMEQQARLGFVGLGNMGGNMAARLLAAGYSVFGEERNREHAESLVHAGLQWCATPREVADRADVVFTSVPNDRVLEQVATGRDGILAGLGAEGPSQQTSRGHVGQHDLPPNMTQERESSARARAGRATREALHHRGRAAPGASGSRPARRRRPCARR
jgi:hypothetical protein